MFYLTKPKTQHIVVCGSGSYGFDHNILCFTHPKQNTRYRVGGTLSGSVDPRRVGQNDPHTHTIGTTNFVLPLHNISLIQKPYFLQLRVPIPRGHIYFVDKIQKVS